MAIDTTLWDPVDHLTTSEAIQAYIEAALEHGDPDVVAAAQEDVARARALLPPMA